MLRVLGTLVLALSSVQAFAPPSCVLRVPVAVRCQRRALASAARDAESRRKMAIFDACAHTLCRTRLTTRCCHRLLTECALHQRRCGKGRAITREETEELRSVGGEEFMNVARRRPPREPPLAHEAQGCKIPQELLHADDDLHRNRQQYAYG